MQILCSCTLLLSATCIQLFIWKQTTTKINPELNHLVTKTATEKETTAKEAEGCTGLYPAVLLIYTSGWLPSATQYSHCVLRKTHGKQQHPNPFRWTNTYNPSIKSFFSRNYPPHLMDSTLKSCQGPQSYRWHLAVSPIIAAERSDS